MNLEQFCINFYYISIENSIDDLKLKKLGKNSQLTGRIVRPEKRETIRVNTIAAVQFVDDDGCNAADVCVVALHVTVAFCQTQNRNVCTQTHTHTQTRTQINARATNVHNVTNGD